MILRAETTQDLEAGKQKSYCVYSPHKGMNEKERGGKKSEVWFGVFP